MVMSVILTAFAVFMICFVANSDKPRNAVNIRKDVLLPTLFLTPTCLLLYAVLFRWLPRLLLFLFSPSFRTGLVILTGLLLPAVFSWLQSVLVLLFNPQRVATNITSFWTGLVNAKKNIKEMKVAMEELEQMTMDLPRRKRKVVADWIKEVETVKQEVTNVSNKYRRRWVFGFLPLRFRTIYGASRGAQHIKEQIAKLKSARPPRAFIPVPEAVSKEGIHSNASRDSIILREMIKDSKGKLVGMEEHMSRLEKLLQCEEPKDMIISIWGPVGVGKTALVCDISSSILAEQFDHIASVSLPLGGDSDKVLELIAKQVSGKEDNIIPSAALALQHVLGPGKYLLILDDVQAADDFYRLWPSLPYSNSGSRVIITTQFKRVANLAQENCRIEIKPLEEETANELFRIKALSGSSLYLSKSGVDSQLDLSTSSSQDGPCRRWPFLPYSKSGSRVIRKQFKRVANPAQENCRIQNKPLEKETAKKRFRTKAHAESSFDLTKSTVTGTDIVTKDVVEDSKTLNDQRTSTEMPNVVNSQLDLSTSSSQDGPPLMPQHLVRPASDIFRICGGLPLAIVTVADALSRLEQKQEAWEGFFNDFQWHLDINKSLSPLKLAVTTAFKNLPEHLKSCLLLCSTFPINFQFTRKKLIRLWVADGFVEQRGNSSLEEMAEQCLNEIADRCMFEVLDRNSGGRIRKFRMHATIQIIISDKSRKESFSMFCDRLEDLEHCSEARHLCLHKCNVQEGSTIDFVPGLRSFMALRSHISSDFVLSLVCSCKYLTVLHLENSGIESIPDDIGDLFNLRYLNLRSTNVHKLPETVRKLANLQTLDIACTWIMEFPNEVAMLNKLRHFFAGKVTKKLKLEFDLETGVAASEGMNALKELQTLFGIDASDKLLLDLQTLSQLRSLTVTKVKSVHCTDLCAALKKLRLLSSLRIIATNENEQLSFENLDGALSRLQKFEVQGRLSETVCESLVCCLSKNAKFSCLYLGWTGLKSDPLPILGHLRNLGTLILNKTFAGDQLHFVAHAFPKLKSLSLTNMGELGVIKFDEKSAEKLENLILMELPNLDDVEGIEHIMSLQKLSLRNLQPKVISALEGKVSKDKLSVKNEPKHAESL